MILMVASGMEKIKKPFLKNKVENIYLNYGLLGLGTKLCEKGYNNVKLFQGDNKKVNDILEEIQINGVEIEKIKYPIFVSVPSFFSISWAKNFISCIKNKNPNIKVILGGRWVIDENLDWCKSVFKEVDFFSLGCSENIIEMLLDEKNWKDYKSVQVSKEPFSKFNFNILNNFKDYQPVIEICRGCGRGCEFCLEKNYPVSAIKKAQDVILEAKYICDSYETYDLNFYFQASIFNPTIEWAKEFEHFYNKYKMSFKWRFETRVDTINLDSLKILSSVGLKVIDLGLETASIAQIKRMKKSNKPEEYLIKADRLLRTMYELGIWSKLNILLYIGETTNTIQETLLWLEERKHYIKGVSVNPVIVYLNGDKTESFINYIEKESQMKVNRNNLYEYGYTFIDLSKEIDFEKSKNLTNSIMDKFMSSEDYFMLKEVGYTKRVH